jgi:murein tripeptide amidase MpaA
MNERISLATAMRGAAVFLVIGASSMADAQTPSQPLPRQTTAKLDPESFLPPVPAWSGASEKLILPKSHKWATPGEPDLISSPSFDDTIAWLQKVDKASNLVGMETFATTPQGRKLQAVIVSKDGATLNKSKPLFLIQAGIHSGEIDGKDAGLMLIRDICFNGRDELIDKVNIVFVPVFNADGHERTSAHNRPNQRGPKSMGWRNNAQNLNLNRD